jgi:MFS family permease
VTAAVPTASAKQDERRALGVACGAHALHDGYTDLVYVMLPIWQAEFGLGFAALGLMRTVFSGTLAGFQIPAGFLAERFGTAAVLALGTACSRLYLRRTEAASHFGHCAHRRPWREHGILWPRR